MARRNIAGAGILELLDRASQGNSVPDLLVLLHSYPEAGSVGCKISTLQSCLSCFDSC